MKLGKFIFSKSLKKQQNFLYHCRCCKDSKFKFSQSFSPEKYHSVPFITTAVRYCFDSIFDEKYYYSFRYINYHRNQDQT